MRAYIHWFILGLLALVLTLTTIQAVGQYSAKNTVRGVSNATYVQAISDTLSPTNSNFDRDNITIHKVLYASNSIAVVKVTAKNSGLSTYAMFELKDNKLYLTNYSQHPSVIDFDASSDITNLIINTVNNT